MSINPLSLGLCKRRPAFVFCLVSHEVPAPHLAGPRSVLPLCRRDPQPLHPSLFLAYFDSFFASNPCHSFGVNLEPIPAHQRRDSSIPRTAQLEHFLADTPSAGSCRRSDSNSTSGSPSARQRCYFSPSLLPHPLHGLSSADGLTTFCVDLFENVNPRSLVPKEA
jgi:hypothetical protein